MSHPPIPYDSDGRSLPRPPRNAGTGILGCSPNDFHDAAEGFGRVHNEISSAVNTLTGVLGQSGGMAGSDSGAQKWAEKYDPAASDSGQGALAAATDLVNGAAMMRDLLAYSGANHHNADNRDNPVPAPGTTLTCSAPNVPKAFGGDSHSEPAWWKFIAKYVEGFVWPNGHQDKLRAAAQGYRAAAGAVRCATGHIPAIIALINAQQTPEVPAAAGLCATMQAQIDELAAQFEVLGKACDGYAQQIDDAHSRIIDAAWELGWQTALIQGIGGVLSFFSFGSAEVPTQGIETWRLAAVGKRIADICKAFAAAAEVSGLPAVAAAGALARVTIELRPLLDARAVLYTTVTGKKAEEAEAAAARAENMTVEQFEAKYGKPGAWKYPDDMDPAKPYAVPGTVRDVNPAELRGQTVDRYGMNKEGGWLAPEGTPFGERGLTPGGANDPITTYKIGDGPLPSGFKIEESKVAPWFGQPGGGVQYRIIDEATGRTARLEKLIRSGLLVEVKK